MRRLLSLLLLLAFPIALEAGGLSYAQTTHGQWVLGKMFKPNGVGWPGFAADPFACGAASEGISYYNTTTHQNLTCTGAAWTGSSGGVTSPIVGDFVATGRWTFGASAGAANAVDLSETAGCITFEGAADGFEDFLCSVSAGQDQTFSMPDLAGAGPFYFAIRNASNGFSAANTFANRQTFGGGAGDANTIDFNESAGRITFEGSTGGADTNETRLAVTDPTADRLITFPDTTGNVALDSTANVFTADNTFGTAAGAANAVDLGETAGRITFEGATGGADAIETRLGVTDPTVGDQLYLLPNRGAVVASDTIATLGASNAFTGTNSFSTGTNTFGGAAGATDTISFNETAGQITIEGTGGANAFETRLVFNDPTADNEILFYDQTFTVAGRNVDNAFNFQTFNSSEKQVDNEGIYLGTSVVGAAGFIGSRTALTPDSTVIMTGSTSNSLQFYEIGDNAYDFTNGPCGSSACTDPTLIGHSHNQATTQWWSITHDGSNAIAKTGAGMWSFPPRAGGSGSEAIGAGSYPSAGGTGTNNTCVGSASCTTLGNGDRNTQIGQGTVAASGTSDSIAIGNLATNNADYQAVIGSPTSYISNLYFSGVTSTSPDPIAIHAPGGSGSDIAGANITMAGGLGTGLAIPGDVAVTTGRQIGTGSTLQTSETRALIVGKTLALADAAATNILAIAVPNDTICSLTVQYHAWSQDANQIVGDTGQVSMLVYEEPGSAATYACDVDAETDNALGSDGQTLSPTWSCAAAATSYLKVAMDEESADLASTIIYNVTFNSGCALTPQ